jgi:hypothetical protein
MQKVPFNRTISVFEKSFKHTVFTFSLTFIALSLEAQTTKCVFFNRCYISIYQQAMMMPSGKWDAMYENLGWADFQGKISVDEPNKTIVITYTDGENRTIKNIKKEIIGSFMDDKGIVQTVYRGLINSDLTEAKLEISETKNNICTIKYYSQRIIDTGLKISGQEVKFNDFECFKNIILFNTNGECLKE